MRDERYSVMKVECPRFKTKQKIHVAVRAEPTQLADHAIPCLNCNGFFKVTVPNRIVDGPFPA
jgi:hypothetical protein